MLLTGFCSYFLVSVPPFWKTGVCILVAGGPQTPPRIQLYP